MGVLSMGLPHCHRGNGIVCVNLFDNLKITHAVDATDSSVIFYYMIIYFCHGFVMMKWNYFHFLSNVDSSSNWGVANNSFWVYHKDSQDSVITASFPYITDHCSLFGNVHLILLGKKNRGSLGHRPETLWEDKNVPSSSMTKVTLLPCLFTILLSVESLPFRCGTIKVKKKVAAPIPTLPERATENLLRGATI